MKLLAWLYTAPMRQVGRANAFPMHTACRLGVRQTLVCSQPKIPTSC